MPSRRVRFDLALVAASIDQAVTQAAQDGKPGAIVVMPLEDPKAFRILEGDVGEIEALAKLTGPVKPGEFDDPPPPPKPPKQAPKRVPKRKPPTRRKRKR